MSHHIEYRITAKHVPACENVDGVERFIVCIEGGDNNCGSGTGRDFRPEKNWRVMMMGTIDDVMEQACYYAVECDGGMVRPQGKVCTPEAYIKRVRRVCDNARRGPLQAPDIKFRYDCEPGSEHDLLLTATDATRTIGKRLYATSEGACFAFTLPDGTPDYRTFFGAYPTIGHKRMACDLATCSDLS